MKRDGVVRILISRAGHTGHYNADFVHLNGVPHAVPEWAVLPTGDEEPAVAVPLDLRHLHQISGWGEVTHMYEFPIDDPRPLH
jgi:hypothetical protein